MSLAALPTPTFTGADLSSRTNAALLEVRAARRFATAAALLADATLAYGTGARPVAAGDRIETADGHRYEVAPSAATDHHLVTAGGAKLHVRPGPRGLSFAAWAPDDTGVADVTAKFQSFIHACVGSPTAPNQNANRRLNIPGVIPNGIFRLTDETRPTRVVGWSLTGAGAYATVLRQETPNKAVIRTNGFSKCMVEGIAFETTAATTGAVFDLDWDGAAGGIGCQSNTFKDCAFSGQEGGANPAAQATHYGLRIAASGSNAMGSENLFLNCFVNWCRYGYATMGFNALQNSVIGGNIQACWKGIYQQAGSFTIIQSVGFQNDIWAAPYDQVTAAGWDIEFTNSASDLAVITACRTESLRFCSATNAYNVQLDQNTLIPSRTTSRANSTAYAVGAWISGGGYAYKCTTAGTSAGSAPTWGGATVTDGTVTWTRQDYDAISGIFGTRGNTVAYGQVGSYDSRSVYERDVFSRPDFLGLSGGAPAFSDSRYLPLLINPVVRNPVGSGAAAGMHQRFGWAPTYLLNVSGKALLWGDYNGHTVGFERGRVDQASDDDANGIGAQGTIQGRAVSGTNVAGKHLRLAGGPGTGSGAGGDIIFSRPVVGSSGTTVQSWTEAARVLATGGLRIGGGGVMLSGTGDPEGVITAPQGSVFMRTNGGAGTSLYVKESGTGNTGWAAYAPASPVATINAQTGTAYALVLADRGSTVTMANAAANVVTIPANAGAAFPIGTEIAVMQRGAGATTITGATGVTVNGTSGGSVAVGAQWASRVLLKVGTDEWVVS